MFCLCSESAIPGGRRWGDKGRRAGLGLRLPVLTALAEAMPLYAAGVGWLLPALIGAAAGLLIPAKP